MRLRALALSVLVASLVPGVAIAQKKEAPAEDSVVLKSGQMVTGKILDDDPKNGVTIKLANGKVRVIPPADVKLVERAEPAPAKKKPAPKATDDEPEKPAKDEEEGKKDPPKAAQEPEAGKRGEGLHIGAGLAVGPVFSRANNEGSLKLLSPFVGVHGAFDVVVGERLYLRVEPSIGTFARTSKVDVPVKVDTTVSPNILVKETITNKVRVIDLFVRAMLGYDYADALTGRAGLRVGYGLASTSASQCSDGAGNGMSYGASLVPIGVRAMKKAIEVSLLFDYAWEPTPRCDVPGLKDGLVVEKNAITVFVPKVVKDTTAVGILALSATYYFK